MLLALIPLTDTTTQREVSSPVTQTGFICTVRQSGYRNMNLKKFAVRKEVLGGKVTIEGNP